MSGINKVLFLAFPNVGEQDLLAPWELFRALAYDLGRSGEQLEVTLGSLEGGTMTTHMGAQIHTEKVNPEDRYDLLYIPGGIGGGAASHDPQILDLIRAHHTEGRWVAANCAGVGVVFRSGILQGTRFQAAAVLGRRLKELGADVAEPRRAWSLLPDAKIFTAGGAATVHPSTIALITHLYGEDRARTLAATWDTLPLHGETLFNPEGPLTNDDDTFVKGLQNAMEKVFLPDN
ncbi:DJ-1/PfpI family protein [Streptomyces sp. NPDC005281]|uniref:DJ-1/PfpI family protein n=1 Tax=Streptomyces sp. NPDC005281 TaxID=3155712 RepID=UPI0033A0CB9B